MEYGICCHRVVPCVRVEYVTGLLPTSHKYRRASAITRTQASPIATPARRAVMRLCRAFSILFISFGLRRQDCIAHAPQWGASRRPKGDQPEANGPNRDDPGGKVS